MTELLALVGVFAAYPLLSRLAWWVDECFPGARLDTRVSNEWLAEKFHGRAERAAPRPHLASSSEGAYMRPFEQRRAG